MVILVRCSPYFSELSIKLWKIVVSIESASISKSLHKFMILTPLRSENNEVASSTAFVKFM